MKYVALLKRPGAGRRAEEAGTPHTADRKVSVFVQAHGVPWLEA